MAAPSVRSMHRLWGRVPLLYVLCEYVAFGGSPSAIRQTAVDRLRVRPGAHVLEIGCGTGRNFRYILDAIGPTGHLVGVDYSADMLATAQRICRTHGWDNVKLIHGDAARTTEAVDVGSFDAVLFVLALNGLTEPRRALRNASAALRPGGHCVVCDKQPFTGWARTLNPPVGFVMRRLLGWRSDLQVSDELCAVFGNVESEERALGSIEVATARREPTAA